MDDITLINILRLPFDDHGDANLIRVRSTCCLAANKIESNITQIINLKSILTNIINDLPEKRDWLDPDTERSAKLLITDEKKKYDENGDIILDCSLGGTCIWGIDGCHSNIYCKKCFRTKPQD